MHSFEWGYVLASAVAAIAAVIGVLAVNRQKAFELLTKERLKQLEIERSATKRLRLLTSMPYISKMRGKSVSPTDYQLQLEKEAARLKEVMTVIEKQESVAFDELTLMQKKAIKFYMKPNPKSLTRLKNQKERFFMMMEVYDWSIWNYIQKLYRKTGRLHKRYDRIYANNYYRMKKANPMNPFFKKYPLCEQLTDISHIRLRWIQFKNK